MLETFSTAMEQDQIKRTYLQSFFLSKILPKDGAYRKYNYLEHLDIDTHFGFEELTG
jgi:hypothetical protein